MIAYPGSDAEIRRELLGVAIEPTEMQVEPGFNLLYAGLPLNRVIWRGADDGSDAT